MKVSIIFGSIIFVAGLIFISCSPVRNTTFRSQSHDKIGAEIATYDDAVEKRFTDTTIIRLPDVLPVKLQVSDELKQLFDSAVEDMDAQRFDSAMKKLTGIKSSLNTDDSLYYESEFYLIECIISMNHLDEALIRLESLLAEQPNDSILERVLVRLGQIHCAKSNQRKAAMYFTRLADTNPNSIYLKVANCDFLNKSSQ
ncbi:MAG: hypothetical protein RBT61_09145 [Candidatus Kapabacteria bacterium]|nr:hypothetical protein [Candidatus Kapabacteria bacterium]